MHYSYECPPNNTTKQTKETQTCVCFHFIFQQCPHLMTFPTLSIYGIYFLLQLDYQLQEAI